MTTSASRISTPASHLAGALPPPGWVFHQLAGAATVMPVTTGRQTLECRYHDSLALVSIRCENAADLSTEEFRRQAVVAYDAIGRKLRTLATPHPIRFWNHIPSIHEPCEDGTDRYMVFNAGRFEALSRWLGEGEFSRLVPTASGVGHHGRDLIIHCLAGRQPGIAIANPRQVAPYHYSQRFGPLPPCFARATVAPVTDESLILVGGTASVRGEDSVYLDDLPQQAHETLANLASVIRAALGENVVEISDHSPWLHRLRDVRIYFPHERHRQAIATLARTHFAKAQIELHPADLCRKELLIEIEGVAKFSGGASPDYDTIIVGGGPAGSTSALILARAGLRVIVLEKARFPRLHIGESILPRDFPLIQELGLEASLNRLPYVPKYGAEFVWGDDPRAMTFTFDNGLIPGTRTFNVERALFDEMLLNEAAKAGAVVRQETAASKIVKLEEGSVAVQAGDTTITGRILLDASGHGTIVGRHLGIRKNFAEPELQKVAYFNHFDKVWRRPGNEAGHPGIVMCKEGWFWLITLNEQITSVGFVTHPSFVKQIGVAPDHVLQWAIARCPTVRDRMANAIGPADNYIVSDFSYKCQPIAGPGYFMVGDAGAFLDPIFSTGVTLAMMGATQAAKHTQDILAGKVDPSTARRQYIQFVEGSTAIFWKMIRNYYKHSFRELFMNGQGPLKVHNAIISILAGNVFPRPPWSLRWRMKFFGLCVWANQYMKLVPHHRPFSLLAQTPAEYGISVAQSTSP